MPKILIFIGPPGSGKGTQAKKFAGKLNYGHISTGDLLRALASDNDIAPDEKAAIEEMKEGKLVPDWLIYRLVFREIEKYLAKGQGVVLDGAIRNLEQAKEYQKFFEDKNLGQEVLAVEISLTDDESFNRLTKRRMCESCGEIIPWLASTKNLTVCPKCNGRLITRPDDEEKVIKERIIEQGNTALKPILDYYLALKILKRVDGMKDIDGVEKEIERALGL
ncbi:MAG: nucleoside monophosphate kinase [Patescibacteria group bacterium]